MNRRGPIGGGPFVVAVAIVLLVIAAYVLSCGPAVYLAESGYFSRDDLRIYAPLDWLAGRSPAFREVLASYVELWLPDA
jgi:hypothetical protein